MPLFQGRTCLPTNQSSDACTLGGSPSFAVNVLNVAQIQFTVNFARNANLRLVIKYTGHDYLGKSTVAGSLSIWTLHLKDTRFIPSMNTSSYNGPAMQLGAGVQVAEVYAEAEKQGVTALGGVCETVGYTDGYSTGGGHNPLDSIYGMSADQVLDFEVVTGDGRFRTVTNSSNPDLYWALRGDGSGTFAVVSSVIIRVHPRIPVTISSFEFTTSNNVTADIFFAGVRTYFGEFLKYVDAGTYPYFWMYNNSDTLRFKMGPLWAPNHTFESFNILF